MHKRNTSKKTPRNSYEVVEKLVNENMELAYFMANKQKDIDADQAFSLSMQGLVRGAETFDESKGKFGTWAAYYMKHYFGSHRSKMKRARRGGDISHYSLDDETFIEGRSLEDVLADESALPAYEVQIIHESGIDISKHLSRLRPHERYVIEHRFGLNGNGGECETLEKVSEKFGVTRERVRQIQVESIRKLRALLVSGLTDSEMDDDFMQKVRNRLRVNGKFLTTQNSSRNCTM